MINLTEVKVEVFDPRPTGGMYVGYTSYGVKVTHIPSGLVAIVSSERSMHRNQKVALDMIAGGITSPHYRG